MSECYIYVIGREDGPVKVGISSGPNGRLMALQIGCPFTIGLLHQRKCRDRDHALQHESIFHDVYAPHRLRGEWFDMESDLAIEGVDTLFDFEEWEAEEARHERICAELNIWQ